MRGIRKRVLPVLLGLPGFVASNVPAHAGEQQADPRAGDIVVYGGLLDRGVIAGIAPDNELTAADIAAYGADTVGDLLTELSGEVDSSPDGPVILINGHQVAGIDSVSDLPTEAVSRIQVLPRRVAGQLGQRPTRRVINVVIKDNHRQVTGNLEGGFATAGDGRSYKGELNLLNIKAGNRDSLVLRVQQVDPLFESDRNIISETPSILYDSLGNVLAFPTVGTEIDPALSAVAGRITTVAGVPAGSGSPTLAAFVVNANRANATDVRPFRTLVAERRVYSANGNVTRIYGETIVSFNGRAEWTETASQSGLVSALLRLPVGTRFSPFSRDVNVARFLPGPLDQQGRSASLDFDGNLTTPIGKWRLQVLAGLQHRVDRTDSEVAFDPVALRAAISAGTVNPFTDLPLDLIVPRHNFTRSRIDSGSLRATFSGPLAQLPSGAVRGAVTASLRTDRLRGNAEFLPVSSITGYKRDEAALQAYVQIPLVSDKSSIGAGSRPDRRTARDRGCWDRHGIRRWAPLAPGSYGQSARLVGRRATSARGATDQRSGGGE